MGAVPQVCSQAAMVERLVYRKHSSYNTRGNKIRPIRTPGGRLLARTVKKRAKGPHCGDCKKRLIGIPALRPVEYSRLKKRKRSINRAYGGSRCGGCVRMRNVRAFLIEEQKCVKQVLAEKMSATKEPSSKKSKKK